MTGENNKNNTIRALFESFLRRVPFARSAYSRLDLMRDEINGLKNAVDDAFRQGAASVALPPSMLADQRRLVPKPSVIVDVGAHHGQSTVEYLDAFPSAHVFAFEPDEANNRQAVELLRPYGDRVRLSRLGLAEHAGKASLHINSHDGTHSLLPIGDMSYWHGQASEIEKVDIETTTLDSLAASERWDHIDILKMDIQGAELAALKGGAGLLAAGAIDLLCLEVEFEHLYEGQPLFWEIAAYLNSLGYRLYRVYEWQYGLTRSNELCWADAIFISPRLRSVSNGLGG
ncbi:FkbM family methyltransferase [Agrobacterium sp. ICMP 6402]|uniref:FkbM family methyltransferase n=1 Tax=Agrobacterium sp. ICMP 6402 TaxID=2292443 RepID=UPI001295A11B|nr:FkbM family methyltransferase [Agrobacterium sp. ICMP 6402]MQB09509.1 FkbM family methyltransferase [Agrobacterium sp. ICMP 6402]